MKKYLAVLWMIVLLLGATACELPKPPVQLSDEEVVIALLEAFRNGDYEGLKPYISDDNPLHLFFTGMDEAVGGELALAYQALHEQLTSLSFTAEAVEDGKHTVQRDFGGAALAEQIKAVHTAVGGQQRRHERGVLNP